LVHYEKDRSAPKSVSVRHSQLYLEALELVKMGDLNIASFGYTMDILVDVLAKLAPLSVEKDGIGLAEKEIVPKWQPMYRDGC
jgi:hypothetical protein